MRAEYPGANPKVIAETVATPLEEAINGVETMMYMKSVAGSDGVLVTTVTFRPGTDPDQAQVQVQNRVAQAEARLPGGCTPSGDHHPEAVSDADPGGASVFAKREVRLAVYAQLRHAESEG
ncbi:RND multidrug efflux transporter, Acriflavin resistance protein [Klebsiella pneumoniae]|uniref:RND multidrug efflux transporter, Acriflavin resistance protein n=1 Tax=Klebsiella pneumoniae TaxID=573 RepID=A0A2X1QTM6_KLEPN|nr:RND multidrug efflux transporter, Acriflavin resistance protein [Klebsiella pneumoniae]